MNKKLILTLSLSLLLPLSSCGSSTSSNVSSNNEVSSSSSSSSFVSLEDEGKITKTINAQAYYNTYEQGTLNIYYFDSIDIPYVNVKEFYESTFVDYALDHKDLFTVNNNVVTNKKTNATMILDSVNDTLTFSDYDMFSNIVGTTTIPNDIFAIEFTNPEVISIDEKNCSYVSGGEFVIDLKDYETNLISYNNEYYIPFSYLEVISLSPYYSRYVFNGNDIYNVNLTSTMLNSNGELNSYGKAYYSGYYNKDKQRSEDYAKYFYNSFLFEMELTSGKLDQYGITDLDAKLDELGLKSKLLSTTSSTADNAIGKAINQIFHDGGHTCFNYRGNTVEYNSEINSKLFSDLTKYDTKYSKVYDSYVNLGNIRGSLNQNLDIYGSTAIIRFDTFESSSDKLTLDNISSNTSTYGIIYNAFEEIKNNSSITNVVFDLSLNLGGDSSGLACAYSFISDEPVTVNITNPVTHSSFKEAVKIDNDLDGDFDDDDSFDGKYNFYVITSPASFSCANMFALLSKDNAKAKVIGTKSSGGDCSVKSGITIDGSSFNMSSTLKYVSKDGSSADDGVDLDYTLNSDYYYSPIKLDTYLNSLN